MADLTLCKLKKITDKTEFELFEKIIEESKKLLPLVKKSGSNRAGITIDPQDRIQITGGVVGGTNVTVKEKKYQYNDNPNDVDDINATVYTYEKLGLVFIRQLKAIQKFLIAVRIGGKNKSVEVFIEKEVPDLKEKINQINKWFGK